MEYKEFKLEIKDGKLYNIRTFKPVDVEVNVKEKEQFVGKQEAYDVVNVIEEDKVPVLLDFLKEELAKYDDYLKSWTDVRDNFEKKYPGLEKLKSEFDRLIVLSNSVMQHKNPNVKKLRGEFKALDNFCDEYNKYVNSLPNIKVITPNLEKINYQIDFITKNYPNLEN